MEETDKSFGNPCFHHVVDHHRQAANIAFGRLILPGDLQPPFGLILKVVVAVAAPL